MWYHTKFGLSSISDVGINRHLHKIGSAGPLLLRMWRGWPLETRDFSLGLPSAYIDCSWSYSTSVQRSPVSWCCYRQLQALLLTEKMDPLVSPFEVTEGHRNWHGLIEYLLRGFYTVCNAGWSKKLEWCSYQAEKDVWWYFIRFPMHVHEWDVKTDGHTTILCCVVVELY